MGRMSNRDRIARAAEEARLAAVEKAEKAEAKKATKAKATKSAKKTTGTRSRATKSAARMKVVWEVTAGYGKALMTFPYPEKAAAEAKVKELSKSSGVVHILREAKVPMD